MWNLVVCERGKLTRLRIQYIREKILEHCIRLRVLPGRDMGVDQGYVVLVSNLESCRCSVGLQMVVESSG